MAYVDCATNSGFLVAFKCRQFNKDMNECVKNWTTKESMEKWVAMKKELGEYK